MHHGDDTDEDEKGNYGVAVKFHDSFSSIFAGFGAFSARHTFPILLVGFLLFVLFSFGIFFAEEETELEELWIEKGTRVRDEKDFYDDRFGGNTRQQFVAIQDSQDLDNVISRGAMEAFRDILIPFQREEDTKAWPGCTPVADSLTCPTSVTNQDQLKMKSFLGVPTGSNSVEYTQKDFCETPPVPTSLLDDSSVGGTGVNVISKAYQNITACLAAGSQTATLFQVRALPEGWGFDRFPCSRTNGLDCFGDGDYDYPLAMQQLQQVAPVFLAALNFAGTPAPGATSLNPLQQAMLGEIAACETAATNNVIIPGLIKILVASGVPASVAPAAASARSASFVAALKGQYTNFAGFGYWWRKRLSTLGTDAEVLKHVSQAITNSLDETVKVTQCLTPAILTIASKPSIAGPIATTLEKQSGLPCCLFWSGGKVGAQLFGGNPQPSGRMSAIRMVANNFNEDHPVLVENIKNRILGRASTDTIPDDVRKDIVLEWEQVFSDYYDPLWAKERETGFAPGEVNSRYNIFYTAWRSTDDTLKEGGSAETELIIIGYIVLIVYASLSLAKIPLNYQQPACGCGVAQAVYSRMFLAFSGVMVIAISTVASFGLTAVFGIKYSPININLVPFLSLGLGIDDMFVLAHTLIYFSNEKTDVGRIKRTLKVAGPSVFLTSICNTLAFFVAAATPIPAVSLFTLQMGISVVLNFLSLFLLFVPLMVIDIRRSQNHQADCCLPPFIPLDGNVPEEDHPDIAASGSYVTDFVSNYLGPGLRNPIVKIVILVCAAVFTSVMIWNGVENTETGLRLGDIALRGSPVREYLDLQEDNFYSYNNYIVTRNIDYTDPLFQNQFLLTLNSLQASPFRLEAMSAFDSWFSDSATTSFLGVAAGSNCLGANPNLRTDVLPVPADPTSQCAFYNVLNTFINGNGATSLPNLACQDANKTKSECARFNPSTDTLAATRSSIYNQNLRNTQDFVDAINDNRGRSDNTMMISGNNYGFMYGFMYQFWEQYLSIRDNMFQIIGFALIGVFCAAFLFTFSPIGSLILCSFILIIILNLFGMLSLIGVKLNAFSVVNLVMSVGMAVEFTAHITHVFLTKHGSRDDRMVFALEEMMAPMLNGAASSFLAVISLAFARFPFFRDYYFGMFSLMIVIAFIYGMIVLPIVLSLIGPRSLHYHKGEDDEKNSGSVGMQQLDTNDQIAQV